MQRKTTAAVLLTPPRSAESISRRKKEEAGLQLLRARKMEKEEEEKAENLPNHRDQITALLQEVNEAQAHQERELGNAVKNGSRQAPANREVGAN